MRIAAQILLALGSWLAPGTAAAAPCPVDPMIANDGAAAIDMNARFAFIETTLRDGARRSTIWGATWGTIFGASSVALLSITPFVNHGQRIDLWVGASSSAIAFVIRAAVHPRVIRENRWLRRQLQAHGRTCETLHMAERALARSAKNQRRGRSLFMHLGAIVYNVGAGVILGVALHRPLSGIRQASVGMTVGQLMFVTQPMTASKALVRYESGAVPRLSFTPLVLPGGVGLGAMGRF